MSYVIAAPEMMISAATDLAAIGSDVSAAHLAAATPTVSLIPAAADEVSAAVTHLFSQHAANYQATAAHAAAFHEQFVQHLKTGAGSYAGAEAAAAASLHSLTAPAATLPPPLSNLLDAALSTPPLSNLLDAALSTVDLLVGLSVVAIIFGPALLVVLVGGLLSLPGYLSSHLVALLPFPFIAGPLWPLIPNFLNALTQPFNAL